MRVARVGQRNTLRRRSLVLELALVLSAAGGFGTATEAFALGVDRPATARPDAPDITKAVRTRTTGVIDVLNCEDGGAGSLRAAVSVATSGDEIDLSGLSCSVISLSSGAINVTVADLSIRGPGAAELAIDAGNVDRAIYHSGSGTLAFSDVTVRHGRTVAEGTYVLARGGCIASEGTVTLDRAVVSDCTAKSYDTAAGGGIAASAAIITDSSILRCAATIEDDVRGGVSGGGIHVDSGGLQLIRSIVSDNMARASQGAALGAGVAMYDTFGSLLIVDSTLAGNVGIGAPYAPNGANTGAQALGGAVFSSAKTSIYGSTLSGNSASGGGAIAVNAQFEGYDALKLVNSTVSGNTASSQGGGIWMFANGIQLVSTTITDNRATYGGGGIMPRHPIFAGYYANAPDFQSSIVAGNLSEDDNADIYTDLTMLPLNGTSNLIGDSNIAVPSGTLSGDPLLLPLADNGGRTFTHALASSSPAIDAGNNAGDVATDQRGIGYARVVGGAADIGAFEFGAVRDVVFDDGFD